MRARATQNRALSGASPSPEAFGCSVAPRPEGRRVLSSGAGTRALPFTGRAEGVVSLWRSWALMTGAGRGAGLLEAAQEPEQAPSSQLIAGKTPCGKELIAHVSSPRPDRAC